MSSSALDVLVLAGPPLALVLGAAAACAWTAAARRDRRRLRPVRSVARERSPR